MSATITYMDGTYVTLATREIAVEKIKAEYRGVRFAAGFNGCTECTVDGRVVAAIHRGDVLGRE